MARCGLLDVSRDESRSAPRPGNLRLIVQQKFQRPAGQSDRPDASDESRDGRGRRDRRRGRGRAIHRRPIVSASPIVRVSGTAIVLPGDDIDTDRIMPARFLKAITFEGLEAHVFEDDRQHAAERGDTHAFDDASRRQARVLLTGRNFGCGSSREHAPQSLRRWGMRAVIAPSFAEIFFGNSVMIGLPCVSLADADLEWLRAAVRADAKLTVDVDLETMTVIAG